MSSPTPNKDDFNLISQIMDIATLSDLTEYSLEQVVERVGNKLSYVSICELYRTAGIRIHQNIVRERKEITHSNPQLLQAKVLDIPNTRGPASFYGNDFIPDRNKDFVCEGDVRSMFSSAAYLTELYREARGLHSENSAHHIDKRRPDLKELLLDQSNMDAPIPTLTLSNKLLKNIIRESLKTNPDYNISKEITDQEIYRTLSKDITCPSGPFNRGFYDVKASLDERDVKLNTLLIPENHPDGVNISILCIDLGISPGLYNLLTTDVTLENSKEKYNEIFGNISPEYLLNMHNLATRYNLPEVMFNELPEDIAPDKKILWLVKLHHKLLLQRALGLSLPLITHLLDHYGTKVDDILATAEAILRFRRRYSLDDKMAIVLVGLSPEGIFTLDYHKLLADIHGLTAEELTALMDIPNINLSLSSDTPIHVVDQAYAVTTWLRIHKLTVADLIVMTTSKFDTTLTPEIKELLSSLIVGINGLQKRPTKAMQIKTLALYFSYSLGLDPGYIDYLLVLMGRLVNDFLSNLSELKSKELTSKNVPEEAIQFCHRLAQLSLITRKISLTEKDLQIVTGDKNFLPEMEFYSLKNINMMMPLTRFHDVLRQIENASAILEGCINKSLTVLQLAKALGYSGNIMQAVNDAADITEDSAYIRMPLIFKLHDWLQACRKLDVDSATLKQLYVPGENFGLTEYETYENLSAPLQKGLSPSQREAVLCLEDMALSTALCEYYLNNIKPVEITLKTRDELFFFLLIDNQVSAGIMTSLIAEAINSLQLYVNRCLIEPNKESGVIVSALTRPFFKDWDIYNKRYSTWAGVSMLTYFPENYITPDARIGQTGMMDTLLQSLSQSQLTPDRVEEAFNTYLTAFEQVANLKVISGYHDGLLPEKGKTYLVGQSQDNPPVYYWRSVNHDMYENGKFPANAWSEWKEIGASATPHQGLIRPVIFHNRLYLMWIEARQSRGDQQNSVYWEYLLQLSFLRYDDTWSSTITLDSLEQNSDENIPKEMLHNNTILDMLGGITSKNIGLYCANNSNEDLLNITLYEKKESSNEYNKNTPSMTWRADSTLSVSMYQSDLTNDLRHELDLTHEKRIANRFVLKDFELEPFNSNDAVKDVYIKSFKNNKLELSLTAFATDEEYSDILYKSLGFGVSTDLFNFHITFNPGKSPDCFIATISDVNYRKVAVFSGVDFFLSQQSIASFSNKKIPEGSYEVELKHGIGYNEFLSKSDSIELIIHSSLNEGKESRVERTRLGYNTTIMTIELEVIDTKENNILLSGDSTKQRFIVGKRHDLHTLVCHFPIAIDDKISTKKLSVKRTLICGGIKRDGHSEIILNRKISATKNTLLLKTTNKQAQYLEWGAPTVKQTRLNTLFARELVNRANQGIDAILSPNAQKLTEPPLGTDLDGTIMDFSGANALYFWELFYYTPMLIAQRLLQEQQFDQATRWFNFVFNPTSQSGHIWNARPLKINESWSKEPLDNTDPDAVAQSDPMHYKVATLMRRIELYLARGDQAYRRLERDSMNEAKLWYLQAQMMMGTDSHTTAKPWVVKTLSDAVDSIRAKFYILESYQAEPLWVPQASAYTANNLTGLFYPQKNAAWQMLRQTLTQRMYNLRHGLNLDGQPLSLPLFASPADPAQLHNTAVSAFQGNTTLPLNVNITLQRFPQSLDSARGLVGQLIQFGNTLMNVIERQDAEKIAGMMQEQSQVLMAQSLMIQNKALEELQAETSLLMVMKTAAIARKDHYWELYDGDISSTETHILHMRHSTNSIYAAASPLLMTGALAQMAPNIFGMANGGSKWGAVATATGMGLQFSAQVTQAVADGLAENEAYRRRRQEWKIMWKNAENEESQIEEQLRVLTLRKEGANLQLAYLETQYAQLRAQLTMMQQKFSNEKLFGWMRGHLSALYFQFYDHVISRCLSAEAAFKWETRQQVTFIKPGAWQNTWGGLLCGEALALSLTAMETAYLNWEGRALEVERTVSLKQHNPKLQETIRVLVKNNDFKGSKDIVIITLSKKTLSVSVKLSDLKLMEDYTSDLRLGDVRRIKQISVTLPGLVGPYQDIQAILSYSDTRSRQLPRGCDAIAISRGMNDSGQFQLDFNDGKYLPFEGININDEGTLTLRFPNASSKQQTLLSSLSDIILHIRYTIRD